MSEKPLYQIAIERFLDRLSKATPDVQNEVIQMIYNLDPLSELRRQEVAERTTRYLFPELFQYEKKD